MNNIDVKNLDSPILSSTTDDLSAVLKMTEQVEELVMNDDVETLSELGFDTDLIPVMKLFIEKGPKLVGTYSHPCEFDLYKIVASVMVTITCASVGIPMEKVFVAQLDTRPNELPKKPTSFSTFIGATSDNDDPLGIGKLNPDFNSKNFVERIISQLSNTIFEISKERGLGKNVVRNKIREVISERLDELISIKPNYVSKSDFVTQQAQMGEFSLRLACLVLKDFADLQSVEMIVRNIGLTTLSNANEYRSFINETLNLFINIKGLDQVKKLVLPGSNESIALLNNEGLITKIGVNENSEFTVILGNNPIDTLSDEEFIDLIPQMIPLGKLEEFLFLAGGVTIHAGSSHGANLKAVEVLGITGKAKEYLLSLQFGKDKTQGHEGIVFLTDAERNKTKNIQLPLQYLLLGAKGVQKRILEGELMFSEINDLKDFFVNSLIEEVIQLLDVEQ